MLLVQMYLQSGKTLEDLKAEHGVKSYETNGKVCFNYDQLEARNSDPLASQCRGLVLRKDTWDVVACPMFRFFNLEQVDVAANIDWNSAVVEEKMDGTCIIVYFDDHLNKWCCGTRSRSEADGGIDDSDLTFAILVDQTCKTMWSRRAEEMGWSSATSQNLQDLMEATQRVNPTKDAKHHTFVFELTSPINRIVCNYSEAKLTLLAVRNNLTLEEDFPQNWIAKDEFGLDCAKVYSFDDVNHMIEVIRSWNPEDHEGVVVKDKNWNRVKIKNPSYVAYNHMRDSLATSIRGCVEVILLGKEDDVIGMMPEPIAKRILRLKPVIQEVLSRTQRDWEELRNIDDMKHFAQEAVLRLWPPALFALKRGKTPDLRTFALGNKAGVAKIPNNATNTMIQLCKKVDPDVGKLDL